MKQELTSQGYSKSLAQFPSILTNFFRRQPILAIASIATIVTCFFVPIDASYIEYIDFKTLACLFSTLAVVAAFKHIYFFEMLGQKITYYFHDLRKVVFALVFITFFGSMLLANDMALLTFLPLSYYVLESTDKKHAMAFTFILQNIAANLGGMITPFGNPQNLYLYSYYQISNKEFFHIMIVPFITATLLIALFCLWIKPEPLQLKDSTHYPLHKKRLILYSILFLIAILIVFRVLPYILSTLLITLVLIKVDSKAIKEVNYPLLLTFFVFFIFAGNMARIPLIKSIFETILPLNPLLIGILSCQLISNVPSAVLLSRFTVDYQNLLVAVNVGGLGTLIASLASLITFNTFKQYQPNKSTYYLLLSSAINIIFLIVLYGVQLFMAT